MFQNTHKEPSLQRREVMGPSPQRRKVMGPSPQRREVMGPSPQRREVRCHNPSLGERIKYAITIPHVDSPILVIFDNNVLRC